MSDEYISLEWLCTWSGRNELGTNTDMGSDHSSSSDPRAVGVSGGCVVLLIPSMLFLIGLESAFKGAVDEVLGDCSSLRIVDGMESLFLSMRSLNVNRKKYLTCTRSVENCAGACGGIIRLKLVNILCSTCSLKYATEVRVILPPE